MIAFLASALMLVQYSSPIVAGPPSGLFVAASGFSVSLLDGDTAHGHRLSITYNSGSFSSRSFGSGYPWLWDVVSAQYRDGTNQDAYSGFSDGTNINANIWVAAQGAGSCVYGTTSRTLRHSRLSATYYSTMGTKAGVANPVWPSGWVSRTNKTLYATWWQKNLNGWSDNGVYPNAGDASTKWFRIENNAGTLGGANYCETAQRTADTPNSNLNGYSPLSPTNWGAISSAPGLWNRFEVWLDNTNGVFDAWCNGIWLDPSFSGVGGAFEFAKINNWVFSANTPRNDTYWNSSVPTYVEAGYVGYDDGHSVSSGQQTDLGELYVDPDFGRFEISDSSTWNVGSSSSSTREVQGRWQQTSSTTATVYINQGGFSSLSSKYLWYITARSTAVKVGQFQ